MVRARAGGVRRGSARAPVARGRVDSLAARGLGPGRGFSFVEEDVGLAGDDRARVRARDERVVIVAAAGTARVETKKKKEETNAGRTHYQTWVASSMAVAV